MYPSKASSEKFSASVKLLIRDENTNELHLNNEALNIIRNVNARIGVCVCMGEKSSGKSFLLNSVFKYLTNQPYNLFQLNHRLDKDDTTKGCWMNSEIPMLKSKRKLNLLLIDTEGTFSSLNEDHNKEWETKLFIFSYLISSLFIYNTKTLNLLEFDEFRNLSFMSRFWHRLSWTSTSSRTENETKLREEGAHFLLIARDCILEKNQQTNEQFMKHFLQPEPHDMPNVNKSRNKIKKNMLNSFKSFDVFRLPEPTKTRSNQAKQAYLKSLDSFKYDDLNDMFRSKLDKLSEQIRENLHSKSINGTHLNGFQLAEYMKLIVDLLNNNQTICVHSTLLAVMKRESNYLIDHAMQSYETKMNRFVQLSQNEFALNELQAYDLEVSKECILLLHKRLANSTSINQMNEIKVKFYEFRSKVYSRILNAKSSQDESKRIEKVMNSWIDKYKSRVDELQTVEQFENLLEEFNSNEMLLTERDWLKLNRLINTDMIRKVLIEKENQVNCFSYDEEQEEQEQQVYEKEEEVEDENENDYIKNEVRTRAIRYVCYDQDLIDPYELIQIY